jgi:hypothetical protein
MTGGIPHSHSAKFLEQPSYSNRICDELSGSYDKKKILSWITHYHELEKKTAMDTELPHPMESNLKHGLPMTN